MEVATMALQRPPVSVLSARQLRAGLRLSRERMARLLDVSAKTIERWEERDALPASGQVRSRLAQLREIADLGLTVYTPDGFPRYLATPLPTFGGRTALQLIEQGEGDRVLAALAADYEGLGF
jgi:transcriptional regulator with XRE-family HTH domain